MFNCITLRWQASGHPTHSLVGVPYAVVVIKGTRNEGIASVADSIIARDKVAAIEDIKPIPSRNPKVAGFVFAPTLEVVQLLRKFPWHILPKFVVSRLMRQMFVCVSAP